MTCGLILCTLMMYQLLVMSCTTAKAMLCLPVRVCLLFHEGTDFAKVIPGIFCSDEVHVASWVTCGGWKPFCMKSVVDSATIVQRTYVFQ